MTPLMLALALTAPLAAEAHARRNQIIAVATTAPVSPAEDS